MREGCIFCSIVDGTAPAERVFEDEATVAIMDIAPATDGHVLVIPREHWKDLWEIPASYAERVMSTAVHVAGMIRQALTPPGINLINASGAAAWQKIFHFHIHLVPRYDGDGLVPPWSPDQPQAAEILLKDLATKIRSQGAGSKK